MRQNALLTYRDTVARAWRELSLRYAICTQALIVGAWASTVVWWVAAGLPAKAAAPWPLRAACGLAVALCLPRFLPQVKRREAAAWARVKADLCGPDRSAVRP